MLGDNIYEGPATREDYRRKFEDPYRPLLDEGVKFYATLGNHDDPRQIAYPLFNMDGERYYSFSPPEDLLAKVVSRVEFFAVDSTNLDRTQLRWLDERLRDSDATWKVCFFPPSPVHVRALSHLGTRLPPDSGTAARQKWCGRCLLGTRAHLSAVRTAVGHSVLHQRWSRFAPARRWNSSVLCRPDVRQRLSLHAGRDRRRRAALSGDFPLRAHHRCRNAVSGPARRGRRRARTGARPGSGATPRDTAALR